MSSPKIRVVRSAPDPLGLYIRAGRVDHKDLQSFITTGSPVFTGVVFEAKRVQHQKELLTLVLEKGLDAVLDPQTQAMATAGGYAAGMDSLPWSNKRQQTLGDLETSFQQRQMADQIAQFVVQHSFTQVLSPTHLILGPDDPWLSIDVSTVIALRSALEKNGAKHVQLHYSLAVSYEAFRTAEKRAAILDQIRRTPIDGLWLNVDGCGSDSSPTAITRYGDAAVNFQELGVPIIADHAGGFMGLALLAFGTVGGLAHGVTLGERFHSAGWRKKSESKPFSPTTRVYIPAIDIMLPRMEAEKFFESGGGKARTAFGCRDTNCCPRGITDMLQAPARHFLYQRARQVVSLGQIPASIRPTAFLEEYLRPASDLALVAEKLALPDELTQKVKKQARRLNELRTTLGPYARMRRDGSFARYPIIRVARDGRG
ncbi:MAG: hypothetical protein U1F68_04145 [Gammaproteobacteria bacterium]